MVDIRKFVTEQFETRAWRITTPVHKLLEILENTNKALSVHDLMKQMKPKVNTTTVYRILDKLIEIGATHEVANRYVMCTNPYNTKEEHHFLLCEECEKAEEIFLNYHNDIAKQLKAEKDFLLEEVDLCFWGTCSECRTQNK